MKRSQNNDPFQSQLPSTKHSLLSKPKAGGPLVEMSVEMQQMNSTNRDSSFTQQMQNNQSKKKKTYSRISIIKQETTESQNTDWQIGTKIQTKPPILAKDIDQNYDIWDLTYTLITSKMNLMVSGIMFVLFVLIRYYTFACLIYITSKSHDQNILWVLVVIGNRLVYMFLVIKISLQAPQTKTQIVLKSHWNSTHNNQLHQLFQIVSTRKLMKSIIRGMIPAQLAFLYIRANPRKKFQIYTAINYINSSIQAILYYPFFIAYTSILTIDNSFGLNQYYKNATLSLAVLAQFMITVSTLLLVLMGIRRKYGRVFYCCC